VVGGDGYEGWCTTTGAAIFGRLIAYPGTAEKPEPVDQLARVIRRLDKLRSSAKWSAVYEAGTAHVTDEDEAWEEEPPQTAAETEAVIRTAALDTQTLDFFCLSHCSFQLDSATDTVHLAAYYRSHYMFDRAYGNYLALGHLCAWVTRHAQLAPGTLTVMAGCARLVLCPGRFAGLSGGWMAVTASDEGDLPHRTLSPGTDVGGRRWNNRGYASAAMMCGWNWLGRMATAGRSLPIGARG
jgi:hypothetical protein